MSAIQQIAMVLASAALFALVLFLVSHERLQLRHSLLWLVLAAVVLVTAVFPAPLFALARFFGFASASNFLFVLGILFLLIIALSLSSIVSKQHIAIKNAVQRIALLEHELKRLEENSKSH